MEESQNSSTESAQSPDGAQRPRQQPSDNSAPVSMRPRQQAQGILRSDTGSQSRANRNAIVVPQLTASQMEPSSPQPSVDRLSVTFAIAEPSNGDGQEPSTPASPPLPAATSSFDFNHHQHHHPRRRAFLLDTTAARSSADMQPTTLESEEVAEEDDYSASACAIIQRRNSSRRHSRRKRRPSSPFSPDAESALRRRSSVFTTSSGDTAISIDEGGEEQILDNLKLHKEVLHGVKQQPWPLRKKLKLVRQAKAYVRKHEGALQERLAQTRSTRDAIARASILLTKKWQYFKRELVNFKTVLVPWERRIKQIESQFGSAVASYFIFLRWLFWINLVISAALVTFVAIPEFLATLQNATIAGERKIMLPEEQLKSTHLLTLWEFEGYLKYSPFFYGWYANQHTYKAYKLPLAYFVVNLVVYTYSFVAILRKMAKNSRMSKLSEKEDECAFSWKLFTGWDFMIGNAETAHNRIGSIVLGLKEALLEESEKHRDERNWKIMSIRIFVNMLVMALLAVSAYAVVEVVERSEDIRAANSSWWRQNEITVVMTLITYSFPILFEVLGIIESYHPRKQLRLQLGRIMVLNLLNMYSLIYALFKKINSSDEKLQSLKPNDSITLENCFNRLVPCKSNILHAASSIATMSLVLSSNFSSNSNKTSNSLWPNTLDSNQATNYTLPIDNTLNTSQEILTLHEFDANSILSDWTTEEVIFESNVTLFSDPANFSLPSIDSATEIWDSLDNFTHNGLKVRNYLRDMDENPIEMDENAINPDENTINIDENLINIDDNYPHVNYNDYGFLDVDNKTENFFPGLSTENAIQTTTQKVVSNNKADYPAVSTTANSCGDVDRVIRCYERICTYKTFTSDNFSDIKTRRLLRGLCWETMFGQEIAKLTMMDLVLTIFSTMGMDFFRALFVRYMNSCWCWDLEKQFPQYGDFKIAENILHLVNNQGMVWMGIFFSPGLIVLNVIKLVILMYLRSWTVLTCNVPHEIVFKASRSNNFYLALLLTMLFLCVLPVGYAIVWVEPSWHCGPFSGYKRIYYLATSSLRNALPTYIHEYKVLDYIASPGIVIPLIVLMALIIYYMVSLTNSLRESNNDLKIQLRQERTEERRKMFKIAEKRLESHDTPFTRWKKILPATKSIDLPSIVKLSQADQIAEAAAAIAETAIIQEREQKRSGGSDNGELTEGEQESLPNDQIPETTRKESNDSPKLQKATASYRKNGWRASRTKESPPESGESSEGAIVLIPRIRISIEEPSSEVATRQTSASSDPTHTRRKSTNSDYHSQ
ncbi:transmembrane channel-like protein 2 isoform X2 [Nasonia vitripennis]|uniref:TMC domain-containing protein n=1 Tax=Nasonia vitripennis TaxID=7425 RepID=A0A7M7PV76_NASVI|nr:transmembrane channel-like protein 2 isoform X2 [Nasonia vitripennis]